MPEFLFKVLGANSATPMVGRFPSSFVLQYDQHRILLDCGEGAQIKMSQFKIKRSRIDHIFISHLHGDHIFGLPGFINSLGLNGRSKSLSITGPVGLAQYVNVVLKTTGAHAAFDIQFRELDGTKFHELGTISGLNVWAFPLKHRIPTLGYRFYELPPPLNINSAAIAQYQLTVAELKSIKLGRSVVRGGEEIPIEDLTEPPRPLRSFAYCTDTLYDPDIIPFIEGVNLLYHEATYLHDLAIKARERMHSTAYEAAMIARDGHVSKLVVGHYSSRYKSFQPFIDEAQVIFENTHVAEEGMVFDIEHLV